AGPWDWLVIGQYKRLEADRLARVIYSGGITREFPPESRGYLIITDSNFYIKNLRS
ncbi:phosphoesterase, partial [Sulfolobus sp. A20-N-G8]